MILLQKESIVNQVIPEKGSLLDSITIHHAVTIKTIKVGIDIEHPFIGDLKVILTSPNGTSAILHNRVGGSQNNIKQIFEGELLAKFVGQSVQGDWTLSVQDFAPRDSGTLLSWHLEITCEDDTAHSEIFIPEGADAWLVSEQVCKLPGIIEDAQVTVNIEHPFIKDLIVKLKSPDGQQITLHNREGGSADNINKTYGIDVLAALKGKNTAGIWTLLVKDNAPRDSGTLKSWKIAFSYQAINDLTQVNGITAAQAAILNSKGIYSFNKLSTLGTAALRDVFAGTEGDFSHNAINGLLDNAKIASATV